MDELGFDIKREGGIATIRFDRTTRRNALSFDILRRLTEIARSFEYDSETRAIILTGTKTCFSAGMDLKDTAHVEFTQGSLTKQRRMSQVGPRMARAFAGIEQVTIAAVEGPCLGGGLVLASLCDFRVAGNDALFGTPEVSIGLNMSWHSVPRLVSLVGVQATKRLLLLNERFSAQEARDIGLVDYVTGAGTALSRAQLLADAAAAMPPDAQQMVKRQIDAAAFGQDIAMSAIDADQNLLARHDKSFLEARRKFLDR